MQRLVLSFLFSLCIVGSLHAQKALRLSRYEREIILTLDQRIKYQLTDGSVDVGRIEAITDDFIIVDDREISYDRIRKIGRKGSGSNFFGILLTSIGGMMSFINLEQAVDPYSGCFNCRGEQVWGSDGRDLLLSMTMTGAGVLILRANKTRNLEFWKLEVVEIPDTP